MTPQQLATLKTAILADQALAALPNNGDGNFEIANALDAPSDPAVIVWRSSISKDEVYGNGFAWAQIDNVTEPRWRIWTELFDNDSRTMNPSKPNVRAGVGEVWTGTAQKTAVGVYVLDKCKRECSRAEALFAVGVGSLASPASMTFEGRLSTDDIERARNLP